MFYATARLICLIVSATDSYDRHAVTLSLPLSVHGVVEYADSVGAEDSLGAEGMPTNGNGL